MAGVVNALVQAQALVHSAAQAALTANLWRRADRGVGGSPADR
jgi:hypothetical protein